MDVDERGIYIAHRRSPASRESAETILHRFGTAFPGTPIHLAPETVFSGRHLDDVLDRLVPGSAVLVAVLDAPARPGDGTDGQDLLATELRLAREHAVPILPVLLDGAQQAPRDAVRAVRLRNAHLRADLHTLTVEVRRLVTAAGPATTTPAAPPADPLVFISYSHADRHWLDRVRVHLAPLDAAGVVDVWDDTRIRAGTAWSGAISTALRSAAAAVLIISADFLASEFIRTDELPSLLAAERTHGLRILPLIVSSSSFGSSALARFQTVNPLSDPLDVLPRGAQEAALATLHDAVRDAVGTR